MMMKLYTYPITSNALKLELLITAANIQIDRQRVNLVRGEQKTPEFLALNPLGQIPLLVDGEQIFTESNALLIYLAKHHQSTLWPTDESAQGHVLQWLFWQASVWGPVAGTFHHQHVVRPAWGLRCDREALALQHANLTAACRQLEAHLHQRSKQQSQLFLAGDDLSVADLSVAALLLFRQQMELQLDPYPTLQQWLQGL
tara:strand:- start:1309 stop:1908 length:600 start_codon:yes stop_codon:yes gene_type:complete